MALRQLVGVLLFGAFLVLSYDGQTAPQSLCLAGCPVGAPSSNHEVHHPIYYLSNNRVTKFADWVVYQDRKDELGPTRARNWKADPDLNPSETLEPADYDDISSIHMDRGHQAPLASLAGTTDWEEANYLSNITPQSSELNEGSWERLEAAERKVVRDGHESVLYVATGPLYERNMPSLPHADEPHRIPSGYWKIIAVRKAGGVINATAFIFDQNVPRREEFCRHSVTIKNVEDRSHLRFFPNLTTAASTAVKNGRAQGPLLPELGCSPAR